MIEKIISVKNYGPFTNYTSGGSEWDGSLKKNNIIYAPNGSGKTTLSILFDSLNGNNKLITKKKSLFVEGNPFIHLRIGGENYKFKDNKWDKEKCNIVTFNNFYLENNIYSVGSDSNRKDSLNTSKLFIPTISDEISNRFKEIKRLKLELKKIRYFNEYEQKEERFSRQKKIRKIRKDIRKLHKRPFNNIELFKQFEESINKYLLRFTPNMEVTKVTPFYSVNTKGDISFSRAAIEIKINGNRVILTEDGKHKVPLRYILSEGDKNTLALAIFLAKFDLIPDSDSYIVVVDDPFTSFDSFRKKQRLRNYLGYLIK